MYIIDKICIFDAWIVGKVERMSFKIEDWTGVSNFRQARILISAFAIGNMLHALNFWRQFLSIETDALTAIYSGIYALISGRFLFLSLQGESHSNNWTASWVTAVMQSRAAAMWRTVLLLASSHAIILLLVALVLVIFLLFKGAASLLVRPELALFPLALAKLSILPAFYLLAVTPRPPRPKYPPLPVET